MDAHDRAAGDLLVALTIIALTLAVSWLILHAWRRIVRHDLRSILHHGDAMAALDRDYRRDMHLFDLLERVGPEGMTAAERNEFRAMVRRIDGLPPAHDLDDWPNP
jgi:hypothetical protein